MKVGIITFHFVNNFGGALQTYALQRVVKERLECEAEIIDYKNWFICFTDYVRIFPITTKVDELKSGLLTMGLRKKRLKKFMEFISKNCALTQLYVSNRKLKKNTPNCDKYICGSDQIWNPIITAGVVKAYFLEFESDRKKKIAYAPSMGTHKIHPIFAKKMGQYINNIGYLSIRETSSIEVIHEMTGRNAIQLIDPTFLLGAKEWEDIAECPVNLPRFILIYVMQKDDEVYSYALKMKQKLNIPVVDISRYGYKPDFVDVSLVDIGPSEFIGLFQKAECVCTNSYHGLVFSLIFEKKICLIPSKRFSSRISNLLELLHIERQVGGEDVESYMLNYNSEIVRKVIMGERKKSLEYLKNSMSEIG